MMMILLTLLFIGGPILIIVVAIYLAFVARDYLEVRRAKHRHGP